MKEEVREEEDSLAAVAVVAAVVIGWPKQKHNDTLRCRSLVLASSPYR